MPPLPSSFVTRQLPMSRPINSSSASTPREIEAVLRTVEDLVLVLVLALGASPGQEALHKLALGQLALRSRVLSSARELAAPAPKAGVCGDCFEALQIFISGRRARRPRRPAPSARGPSCASSPSGTDARSLPARLESRGGERPSAPPAPSAAGRRSRPSRNR